MTVNQSPEQHVRDTIDEQLRRAGWMVQHTKKIDLNAGYRLLKESKAKRILFLVDTKNLGEQAEQEMMAFVPLDDNRKFTELYNVQRLKSSGFSKRIWSAITATKKPLLMALMSAMKSSSSIPRSANTAPGSRRSRRWSGARS